MLVIRDLRGHPADCSRIERENSDAYKDDYGSQYGNVREKGGEEKNERKTREKSRIENDDVKKVVPHVEKRLFQKKAKHDGIIARLRRGVK